MAVSDQPNLDRIYMMNRMDREVSILIIMFIPSKSCRRGPLSLAPASSETGGSPPWVIGET